MEQIYVIMLIVLGVLAVIDLIVGVSNDAVNFLNSSIGSKAVSFKTTMIVASFGVLVGALFSSGMMEIARSGIFIPSMFSFNDVMIIFLAVMITDILLLDVFNSIGLPTSTTVSIIFELLGAAVCLALYKIYMSDDSFDTLGNYINTKKASTIVYSILLSVILSFSLGSFVQYISRLIFTFHYEKKLKYFGAIFGGVAISAITFFILIKGLKGVSFISKEQFAWIDANQFLILGANFIVFTLLSQLLISYFKINILKVIIIIGTFALALAFAGNDLVNFIGVPIAAFNSYEIFNGSGVSGDDFMMGALANDDIVAPFYFLLLAGVVMVVTLWTSKKAKSVIETGVNLSRQGEGDEKFTPNTTSRFIVRSGVYMGEGINYFLPKKLQIKIDSRFENIEKSTKRSDNEPAFDMVRASVNLMVASILIAIGTSMKLPLSTTYVTFMVAMGTSFADRAWDRESAVYRIAGVFKVINGWLFTALIAFLMAFLMAFILKVGEIYAFVGLLLFLGIMLYRSSRKHKQKVKDEAEIRSLRKEDIGTVTDMITESSAQISKVFRKTSALYSNLIDNLSLQDLAKLKENKKDQKKLEKEIDELKSNVFYFIKNLDDNSVEASKFYILILGYLQDMVQSIDFITANSYSHVANNHKQLKFNQIRDLKTIDKQLQHLLQLLEDSFKSEDFYRIDLILNDKEILLETVSELISKQIKRIRTTETSPKNSKLYFALLLETNDLVKSIMNLLELFKEFNKLNK
ncbi:MAG TPA: inorganic phosphate transporter [Flavobacterium sp.]|mgnify:FL=1|uniref:inorganic phosphate transporter n=1 Tax=Flavobacterium sp. TaxID=239 RepID=UPI001B4E27DB|nr:inorganic phosphate transporter [Flavobacterium sp.]MBP7317149.1 inorganic phosphate transporter [Flavobacterium sp.]HRL70213.1 inorganic phosphate transporter [Flavobacterium sp.]HRM45144.1 inorganic phosphate transporter [Flavobacterium sp.]